MKLYKLNFLIVLLVLNVLYIRLSFNFLIPSEKIFLLICLLIGFSFFLLIRKNKKHTFLNFSIILMISSFITFFSGEGIKTLQTNITKENANKLVEKIESFKDKEGILPQDLKDLEIRKYRLYNFIGVIPKKINYIKHDTSFTISYKGFHETNEYHSNQDEWISYD